jgi:rare lipoprotein A
MTASGVRYDRNKMTAAHPSLPFDTKILITNLRNKRKAEVIIIDRFSPTKDRILNVSYSAAVELDLVESGIAKVGIKIIANPDKD